MMQNTLIRFLALMMTALFMVPASADYTDELLKELTAQTRHLDKPVLKKALRAFSNAQAAGLSESTLFTVIDYSKPSNKPRMWVFDLEYGELLYEELVSHGRGSGELYARSFSNTPESHQSSLGLFITEEPYYGRNGYSLRLDGLEQGINHLAKKRAIVIHGADYVTP
ncbi:MAG TPA: murein L,D-transpeptidase catalytic domain family protein, partial [Gammaproteobacteria bacterium]|nr:murein L,D-transpeptidase catalytic domain family protein [Gammaproteobacteria bacterium]